LRVLIDGTESKITLQWQTKASENLRRRTEFENWLQTFGCVAGWPRREQHWNVFRPTESDLTVSAHPKLLQCLPSFRPEETTTLRQERNPETQAGGNRDKESKRSTIAQKPRQSRARSITLETRITDEVKSLNASMPPFSFFNR
jgi:hypothetical protein